LAAILLKTAPSPQQTGLTAAALDVLTLHIYAGDEAGYEAAIEGLKALGQRVGKPIVCNECVVGAVARKILVLAHRLLTHEEDYALPPPKAA
jgi:hypothetical protein